MPGLARRLRHYSPPAATRHHPSPALCYTYPVISVDGVNVTLQLPETWQVHPVFHQSLVKPYYGDVPDDALPGPTPNLDDDPEVFEVGAIRGTSKMEGGTAAGRPSADGLTVSVTVSEVLLGS